MSDLFSGRDNDEDMMDVGDENDNYDMDMDDDMDENENDNDNDNENDNENDNDNDDEDENDDDENEDDGDDDGENQGDYEGRDGEDNDENGENDNGQEDNDNDRLASNTEGQNGSRTNGNNISNGKQNTEADGSVKDGVATESAPLDTKAIRQGAVDQIKKARFLDIVPLVAIPYAQQCHSMAVSEGPKWLLTGGEDGFIRKYDFTASVEGKSPLTVAQKHNLMDSITKAGVICSYWENEQPMTKRQILDANPKLKPNDFQSAAATYEPKVCPVYALDVERNGYWCLSGLLTGGISLYTMIYNEGAMHHYFRHGKRSASASLDSGHHDTVSVLRLNFNQDRFLSGSWDKTIREWDLHTGKTVNLFQGSSGQVSNIQYRPRGLTDIHFDAVASEKPDPTENDNQNSDVDSLFGDSDEEDANTSKSSIKTEKPDRDSATTASNKVVTDDSIFMSSNIDGTINIWDARVSSSTSALKLGVPEGVPPWCMSSTWSNDGDKIYVGRRNSTVEELSLRMPHKRGPGSVAQPNVSKRLQFPKVSGPVSALSIMPNDNFILCGSNDNIRLYNLSLYNDFVQETSVSKKRATPFFVIPGHHGGMLSNLYVDDTGRFMISTSGNRGWGQSTYADAVLVYSIEPDSADAST